MSKIANMVKTSKSTVHYTIERYVKHICIKISTGIGRPKTVNERGARYILCKVKENSKKMPKKFKNMLLQRRQPFRYRIF